jgi:hypothetical protein
MSNAASPDFLAQRTNALALGRDIRCKVANVGRVLSLQSQQPHFEGAPTPTFKPNNNQSAEILPVHDPD